MSKFIFFLCKIILINAILFILIAFISIKLKLIFPSSDKHKKQDGDNKPDLIDVANMPSGRLSESAFFEIDKPLFRQLIQSQKRVGSNLLCQELSFVTSIDDFPGRSRFNLLVKNIAEGHRLEIQHTKDIKSLIADLWEQKKNAS
jgi:hypothetical protein